MCYKLVPCSIFSCDDSEEEVVISNSILYGNGLSIDHDVVAKNDLLSQIQVHTFCFESNICIISLSLPPVVGYMCVYVM